MYGLKYDKIVHLLDLLSSSTFQSYFLLKVHFEIIATSILNRHSIYFKNSGIKQSNSRSLTVYKFRNLPLCVASQEC